jgi:hypothetical protein
MTVPAPFQPPQGALHPLLGERESGLSRHDVVEGHGNVGSEHTLDLDGGLGCDGAQTSIEVTRELHAFLLDRPQPFEGEDLEPTRVREDGLGPRRESVESAHLPDDLFSRPKVQVVGIPQNDLRSRAIDLIGMQTADGAVSADGHERRSVDRAVGELQLTGTGCTCGGLETELKHGAKS